MAQKALLKVSGLSPFFQVTTGAGSPSDWQSMTTLWPSTTVESRGSIFHRGGTARHTPQHYVIMSRDANLDLRKRDDQIE